MRICVFDTETTSIDKPFVYNIGWVIYDTDTKSILNTADYVVEQIWHNRELFTTAYYADKREQYVKDMRGKKVRMEKLGYITQTMCRVFKAYEVKLAFAYNSSFDVRVFDFNCEWFKVINPFDDMLVIDIRGMVHRAIAFTSKYQRFCEDNALFTEHGNYSTTAESVYRFITEDTEFIEEHTALADARIELDILKECCDKYGCEWEKAYKVYRSIPRSGEKVLSVKTTEGEIVEFPYTAITIHKEKDRKTKVYLRKK